MERCLACEADRSGLGGQGSRMVDTHDQRREMIWIPCAGVSLKIRRAAGLGYGTA